MPDPIRLIVLGAGRHAKEVLSYIRGDAKQNSSVEVVGCFDEINPAGDWNGTRILGGVGDISSIVARVENSLHYITAVGDGDLRRRLVAQVEHASGMLVSPWTLIHPRAYVGPEVSVRSGTCLAPSSVVTTHVSIGRHCVLNVKVSVSHDCTIGDFVTLNPGVTVCGDVRLGDGCTIGAGATIRDKVSVGEGTFVGAGALVLTDLPPYVTAFGVPAKIVGTRTP